jgi:hypothetical protein
MHNVRPKTDRKALLVALNKCSMERYCWPNMGVVAVENHT